MFCLARTPLTTVTSCLPRQSSLLPCRSYFKSPLLLAAKPKKPVVKPRVPVVAPSWARRPAPIKSTKSSNTPPPPEPRLALEPSPPSSRPQGVGHITESDQPYRPRSTSRHFLFAGSVIAGIFLWGAARTNEDTEKWINKISHGGGSDGLDNRTLFRAKGFELAETARRWWDGIARSIQFLSPIPQNAIRDLYVSVAQRFVNATGAEKACWAITALNGAVFIAWQIPRLAGYMTKNFIHYPLSGHTHTLLTGVFSHHSFFHLLFNSMALLSFGAATGAFLTGSLGPRGPSDRLESTNAYHFLAMFVAAGLVSSLVSHTVKLKVYDRFTAHIAKSAPESLHRVPFIAGSLGASGAVYACIAISAVTFPELTVSPIFIPFSVPIRLGVGALVALDVIGILRGWRTFDHFAHFGGALFGFWYALFGPALWARWRAFASYFSFSKGD
ncbi:rhomboid domain-containing protein [Favolaschia claudopus]|uniref:Rhomboid domain-containing protein n=1 Tax=Favolaschia claudopus TaxID=2862362 RepID=A0AAW0AHM4_9AGAR